jgi:plasmid stability protein
MEILIVPLDDAMMSALKAVAARAESSVESHAQSLLVAALAHSMPEAPPDSDCHRVAFGS